MNALARAVAKAIANRMPSTATEATITLPVPPSTNNLFATVPLRVGNKRTTKRIKTTSYKNWLDEARIAILQQRPPHITGRVSVDVQMRQPTASSDPDNRLKATLDALVAGSVIEDDRHVTDLRIRWADVEGCVVVVRAVA